MGDIYGRVRTYNLGFAVFTFFSLLLSITWMTGHAGGVWLITMRIFQGVGAAMLMANSSAILTDVFPSNQRGMALGVDRAAGLQRFVHRVGAGRVARSDQLAAHLSGVGADRPVRHGGGLSQTEGDQPSPTRLASTGPATSPSPSVSYWSWWVSRTGSNPTATTPWGGPIPP